MIKKVNIYFDDAIPIDTFFCKITNITTCMSGNKEYLNGLSKTEDVKRHAYEY